MVQRHFPAALEQALAINRKRLTVIVSFTLLMVLVRIFAYAVPASAFVLFAIWLSIAASYHAALPGLASRGAPDTLQAAAFLADITLLTALHMVVGGGWWMGATVYLVVSNAAFASLPKGLGRAVSVYAAFAFIVMIVSHAMGIGEYHVFLGVQTIEGHYAFATVAALFGTTVMLAGMFLQDSFVRQTRASEAKLRASEEQLQHAQKMEAIGGLAGGMAHDFNNTLTAIRTYAGFMLEDLPEGHPSRREALGVSKAVDHAATITRQLLAFSRRQIMQPRIMSLNDAISEIEELIGPVLGSDVQLSTNLDPALGMTNADPGQISQVLINLAMNARDAMPNGGRLRIETANATLDNEYMHQHGAASPGDYVMIAVRDSGAGMDRATQARIFEPFFTTKDSGKGTGLGLAMVYGIVKQSNGYVWVYSEPGKGTTFKIYLPRVEGVSEVTRQALVPLGELGGTETILLVEDEDPVRDVSSRLLRRAGYTVLEAANGKRALEICSDSTIGIDLLITDMVMPEIGGRELASRVRIIRPDVPLVFMSGYTDDEDLRKSFLENGSAFLEKPFTPELLLSRAREALQTVATSGAGR